MHMYIHFHPEILFGVEEGMALPRTVVPRTWHSSPLPRVPGNKAIPPYMLPPPPAAIERTM